MIIAASAALVLSAACTKTEVTSSLNDEETPISFTNYAPRSLTKAGSTLVDSGALPTNSTIGVYGYSTEANPFSTSSSYKPTFMTNLPVAYTSTSATATATDPVRYWPKTTTNLLSFIAYYPYAADDLGVINSKPAAATSAIGTFEFTQTGDVTTMVDFMISDVANDYYYDKTSASNAAGNRTADGSVPFKLRHMLSKVNFKFAKKAGLDNVEIKVTSASIAGVLSHGEITPSYATGANGDNLGLGNAKVGTTTFPELWDDTTVDNEYATAVTIPINSVYDADGDTVTEDNANIILTTTAVLNSVKKDGSITEQNFLFVPQALTTNVKLTVNYDITQNNNVTHNTSTIVLNTTPTQWGRNDNVIYTITIGLTPITFTADVQSWDPEVAGAYNIE